MKSLNLLAFAVAAVSFSNAQAENQMIAFEAIKCKTYLSNQANDPSALTKIDVFFMSANNAPALLIGNAAGSMLVQAVPSKMNQNEFEIETKDAYGNESIIIKGKSGRIISNATASIMVEGKRITAPAKCTSSVMPFAH